MPELKVIMLTSDSDDEALFEAIMAGASGYLLKQILGPDLLTAVRTVAAGGSLLDPSATTAVLERMRRAAEPQGPLAALSDQERAVLELIGEGLTNRQIGERMVLAEDDQELRLPPAGQARTGAPHPGRRPRRRATRRRRHPPLLNCPGRAAVLW
jgi:FixJ family two-component response regulator